MCVCVRVFNLCRNLSDQNSMSRKVCSFPILWVTSQWTRIVKQRIQVGSFPKVRSLPRQYVTTKTLQSYSNHRKDEGGTVDNLPTARPRHRLAVPRNAPLEFAWWRSDRWIRLARAHLWGLFRTTRVASPQWFNIFLWISACPLCAETNENKRRSRNSTSEHCYPTAAIGGLVALISKM